MHDSNYIGTRIHFRYSSSRYSSRRYLVGGSFNYKVPNLSKFFKKCIELKYIKFYWYIVVSISDILQGGIQQAAIAR